jgi:hypothetical protein
MFAYHFQGGQVMSFLLTEILDEGWPVVLGIMRQRYGAVLKITEVKPTPVVEIQRATPERKMWRVA